MTVRVYRRDRRRAWAAGMVLCAAVIAISACGDTADLPPANNRTVKSVECNDGTLIYVYQEDCASVTCEGHGGVKTPCY